MSTVVGMTEAFSYWPSDLKKIALVWLEKLQTQTTWLFVILDSERKGIFRWTVEIFFFKLPFILQDFQVVAINLRLHYIANSVVSAELQIANQTDSEMLA